MIYTELQILLNLPATTTWNRKVYDAGISLCREHVGTGTHGVCIILQPFKSWLNYDPISGGNDTCMYVWSLTNPAVCLQCRGRGSLFHLLHVLLYQTDDSYPPCITCTSFRSQCSQNSGCTIKFSSHHFTQYIAGYCQFLYQ